LVVLVGAFSLATYRAPAPVYQATIRFTIGVSADRQIQGVDPILTAYQASEYIRDDFVEILHSELFANDVNANLAGTGLHVDKGNLSGAVEKQRRIMSMAVTWGNPDEARQIAQAASKTLETQNAKYFKQLGSEGATVTIIDGPDVAPVGAGLRERSDCCWCSSWTISTRPSTNHARLKCWVCTSSEKFPPRQGPASSCRANEG
jgi:capsular polysaccharide biosynthesis protein